jgi:uncharacterized coiled-coil protein SlyX
MESLQQQISTLSQKVDLVYEVLDRLYQNVSEASGSQIVSDAETSIEHSRSHDRAARFDSVKAMRRNLDVQNYRQGYLASSNGNGYRPDGNDWAISQQDIPIDSSGVEVTHHQIEEQDLSPQIQIQRLTAQLTAAYNRIAALEEQLLAKRWK